MKELTRSLVLPHMNKRVFNERLLGELRLSLTRVLGSDELDHPEDTEEAFKYTRRFTRVL